MSWNYGFHLFIGVLNITGFWSFSWKSSIFKYLKDSGFWIVVLVFARLRLKEPFRKDLLNRRTSRPRRFLLVAFLLLWMKVTNGFAFFLLIVLNSMCFIIQLCWIFQFSQVFNCSFFSSWLDEFKGFFSKYGKVVDCEIIRDHVSKRSRGFGFIVFDNELVVDNVLSEGNMIDMLGTQVSFVQWLSKMSDVLGCNYLSNSEWPRFLFGFMLQISVLFLQIFTPCLSCVLV